MPEFIALFLNSPKLLPSKGFSHFDSHRFADPGSCVSSNELEAFQRIGVFPKYWDW
jgi:hypothetical protein